MLLVALSTKNVRAHSRVSALIGIALASTLLYALGIAARYPLAIGLQHPRANWSTLVDYSFTAGLMHAGVYALLILGYMLALRLVLRLDGRSRRVAIGVIIAGWLVSSALLLGAYPGESLDIFDYSFRGRMLVESGASPLATAPVAFANRPFYEYITWRGQVDTYGPLWEYASATVAWAVHDLAGRAGSLAAYIIGYRLMAIGLMGLCGATIAAIVHRNAPRHVAGALVAWLWNPLVLITTAVGAHNDLLMVLAILIALLLFQRRYWIWGLLALAVAAHVKLTALLILPIIALWLVRRCGWLRAIRIGALALVLAIPASWLLYAPLGGWATLRRMLQERSRLLINSPADLVYRMLQERYGWAEPAAWRVTTLAATLLFCVGAAAVLAWFYLQNRGPRAEIRSRRYEDRREERGVRRQEKGASPVSRLLPLVWRLSSRLGSGDDALVWRGCIAVTLAYLLFGSFWFQHWYLLWVLAPAALLPANRWALTFLPAYCLGALWSDLANIFLRALPGRPFTPTQVEAYSVLAQVAPLLCIVIVTRLWRHVPLLVAAIRRRSAGPRAKPAHVRSRYEMDNLQ